MPNSVRNTLNSEGTNSPNPSDGNSPGHETSPVQNTSSIGPGSSSVRELEIVDEVDRCAIEILLSAPVPPEVIRFFVSFPWRRPSFSAVGFVNQANMTLLECQSAAVHLFSLSNYSIDVVYNPSYFGWSSRNISSESAIVRLLRLSWDEYFNGIDSPSALRLQFCAGDGAYIVRAALQGYEHAQRIFVVATAPSCVIDPVLCFCVRHYRAAGDLTSLCFGPGSHYPEFSVVPRHGESRGTIDSFFDSSTFMELLRLEVVCFHFREELLNNEQLTADYDPWVQNVRDRHLEEPDPRLFIRCIGRSNPQIETRRHYLMARLTNRGARVYFSSWSNLVEAALDEHTRGSLEFVLCISNLFREVVLVCFEIIFAALIRSVHSIHPAAVGIPILQMLNACRQCSVYFIARDQDRDSLFRRMALRGNWLNIICLFSEVCFASLLVHSEDVPRVVLWGYGGFVVLSAINVLCENMIRFFLPLRGRIQRALTVVHEEDVGTERRNNDEACFLGLIERLFRGVWEAGRAPAMLSIAAGITYQITTTAISSHSSIMGSDGENITSTGEGLNSSSSSNFILELAGIGFLVLGGGVVSVVSFVTNVCQVRRMFGRLRARAPQAQEFPLVEFPTAPEEGDIDESNL